MGTPLAEKQSSSTTLKNASFFLGLTTAAVLVPILAAMVMHWALFTGMEAPPSNFGSGSMFDMIAGRYDFINRVLAVGMDTAWRRKMVRVIHESVSTKPRILDVATGTADVALLLRQEIPTATVVGVDPSDNMLRVGREKVRRAGLDKDISLEYADAQDLSAMEPSSFDAATMAFGIRNVPNRETALCQIHRVLKDQARLCILEFSEPDDSFGLLGRIARLFIRHVVPFLGGILSGAPREYLHLQNSIKDFPSPREFGQLLDSLDCSSESASSADGTNNNIGDAFRLDDLIQLNFGSVQLYVATALKPNGRDD